MTPLDEWRVKLAGNDPEKTDTNHFYEEGMSV